MGLSRQSGTISDKVGQQWDSSGTAVGQQWDSSGTKLSHREETKLDNFLTKLKQSETNDMKTIEFRIPMPLTVEEYNKGQIWAFMEQSKLETGGGEGVQVITDERFDGLPLHNGTMYR